MFFYATACSFCSSPFIIAIRIKIATKSGNTIACILATRSHCIYTISGMITGKLIPPINPVRAFVMLETPIMSIVTSMVPEVIFPKRRNASEITFASSPTRSRKPRNIEIMISQNFTHTASGRYRSKGIFPCSKTM